MDRTVVTEQILNNQINYLEKVIQLPVRLPKIDDDKLKCFVSRALFYDWQPEIHDSKFLDELLAYILIPLLNTPRDIALIVNNINFWDKLVYEEINVFDFTIVMALYTKYPEVYEKIYYNADWIFGMRLEFIFDEKERAKRDRKVFEEISRASGSENQKELAAALVFLFPDKRQAGNALLTDRLLNRSNHRKQQRIAHREYFESYFSFQRPKVMLPNKEAEKLLLMVQEDSNWDGYLIELCRESPSAAKLLGEFVEYAKDQTFEDIDSIIKSIIEKSKNVVNAFEQRPNWRSHFGIRAECEIVKLLEYISFEEPARINLIIEQLLSSKKAVSLSCYFLNSLLFYSQAPFRNIFGRAELEHIEGLAKVYFTLPDDDDLLIGLLRDGYLHHLFFIAYTEKSECEKFVRRALCRKDGLIGMMAALTTTSLSSAGERPIVERTGNSLVSIEDVLAAEQRFSSEFCDEDRVIAERFHEGLRRGP